MNIDYSNIKKDGYVVQGLTIIDNNFFISAYKKNNNSRIYVYSNQCFLGKIILNNKHHVGGISYDKKNKIIFVTGSSKSISTYNYLKIAKYFQKRDFIIDLNKHSDIIIKNNLETPFPAATLNIYKGYIYITKFDIKTSIVKIKYYYDNNSINMQKLINLGIINNSFCVQGICFYKNKLYLSSSLGPNKSFISIYDNSFNLLNRRIINQMGIEGIVIKDNNLYSIYEKGKQNLSVYNINQFNKLRTKSLMLKFKYTLNYLFYKKIKNRKHN